MATEDESNPSSNSPTNSALPPYPEMILAAIDFMDEKDGASKLAISKYIESNYENLPDGHSLLLAHHLNKMKDAGELAMSKNNYLRPDPNSPPKRGRGRPPKPKTPLPAGYVPPLPRPRGRPPKAKDHLSPAVKKAATSGPPKPRGRPPKRPRPAAAPAPALATSPSPGVKRGRGRPPKERTVAAVGA